MILSEDSGKGMIVDSKEKKVGDDKIESHDKITQFLLKEEEPQQE